MLRTHYLHGYHGVAPPDNPGCTDCPGESVQRKALIPIPMPALSLPALRQAVATVAPSRLPEFFQEIQDAFTQAGDEDSVFPIRHFYQRWGAAIAIERRPSVAARLHAAERALADPDPAVRDHAIREAAKIVQAAYREVVGC
jgi:hypothetical protein